MYSRVVDHLIDFRCHQHFPSSNKNRRKAWEFRNPVYMTPDGSKEGDEGRSPPWVGGMVAAKSQLSTLSSEGADKPNPRFPDLKHTTHLHKAPWLDPNWIPPWVLAKLKATSWESKSSFDGLLSYGGKKAEVEELWQEFFLDPNEWRDHRSDKINPRFPDFKHRTQSHKALWLDSNGIPPWVQEKLAATTWKSKFSFDGALGYGAKKAEVEELWHEFFSDPTEWRDHRSDKINSRFPDFKHTKQPHKALWLDSKWIPPWVEEKMVSIPPGSIQLSAFARNQHLGRYAQAGQHEKTIELFQHMQRGCETVDIFTFVHVLKACSSLGLLEQGRHIHTMMQPDFEADLYVGTCLVDMYAKCGSIEEAARVFDQMPTRDVVTFSAMISGYVKCGEGQKALELLEQMQCHGVDPDPVTFSGVLNACASIAAIEGGRRMHEEIIRRGYESDVVLGNCLVDMYAKCGSIEEAARVFDQMPTRDVVTFNAMLNGYVKCGEGVKALELFEQMQCHGVDPDRVTFVGVLNACASLGAIEGGRRMHEEIIHRGYESDMVMGNCLVDMYAKCESIEEAARVFDQMPTRDVVTFNAMLSGYVKCGEGQKALELFEQMQGQGVDPDPFTFVGVLNACASVAAIKGGRCMHEEIIRRGYESDMVVGNALVDMYAKCGSIEEAERVFDKMPTRDVVTWNAMLTGYGIHGYAKQALETFKEMCKVVKVNCVTFICLLSACSHVGLVAEGLEYFKSMSTVYNITPTVEHFACVVDILGRAGRLHEAEDLIMSMPMDPDARLWIALLGACRAHVNVEVGERCVKRLLELEPDNAAPYVLLSNIYVAAGKLDSCIRLNEERLDRGVKKIPSG